MSIPEPITRMQGIGCSDWSNLSHMPLSSRKENELQESGRDDGTRKKGKSMVGGQSSHVTTFLVAKQPFTFPFQLRLCSTKLASSKGKSSSMEDGGTQEAVSEAEIWARALVLSQCCHSCLLFRVLLWGLAYSLLYRRPYF